MNLAANAGMAAATGILVTVISSPLVLKVLRARRVIDVPTGRSSHSVPTPRGGGVACLLGLVVSIVTAQMPSWSPRLLVLCIAGALAALGLADDMRSMRVRLRLLIQFGLAVGASCWILALTNPIDAASVALAAAGTVWIVGYVNAFNFMDGINGLAGAAAAVAGITFALVGVGRKQPALAVSGAAMAGAAIGFLPWNVPKARFFLGDVGSYLFGGTTALVVVLGIHDHIPIEALLAPEMVFLTDTAWTLASRIRRGEPLATAHRSHVYQRIQQLGWSHAKVTVSITGMMVVLSALGASSLSGSSQLRGASDAVGVLLLLAYLSMPRLLARVRVAHS